MRTCLFCSNPADSREDAWPHWLTDQFKTSQGGEAQLERLGGQTTRWRVLQPELAVRCVCEHCNNGWMSDLESQAKEFLQPLLAGRSVVLNNSDQRVITRWGVKTAMVLEGQDKPEKRVYTLHDCEALRTTYTIPWRTSVWLATSADPGFFLSTKSHNVPGSGEGSLGVWTTMAFAHLVLQVLTIRVPEDVGPHTHVITSVRRGPWNQVTIKIWPTRFPQVSSPAPLGLNGEAGLNALADRFSTRTLDKDEIDELAV